MSILKFETRTPKSLSEIYSYLTDKKKTDINGIFGIGCNPETAVSDMEFIQKLYYHDNLPHPYLQVIFSFDRKMKLPFHSIKNICFQIGNVLIIDKRQVFGAIHYLGKDSENIHCHFIINFIGIEGTKYKQWFSLRHYKISVNKILTFYGLEKIKFFHSN